MTLYVQSVQNEQTLFLIIEHILNIQHLLIPFSNLFLVAVILPYFISHVSFSIQILIVSPLPEDGRAVSGAWGPVWLDHGAPGWSQRGATPRSGAPAGRQQGQTSAS